jgi:hypothetical protein
MALAQVPALRKAIASPSVTGGSEQSWANGSNAPLMLPAMVQLSMTAYGCAIPTFFENSWDTIRAVEGWPSPSTT